MYPGPSLLIQSVLTARLAEYLDPWDLLDIERTRPHGPRCVHYSLDRNSAYNHARIRYFMDEFRRGCRVDPIELDCRTERTKVYFGGGGLSESCHCYAKPIMLDGLHRLAGAILAKAPKIQVRFSGRVDLLRYLQGRRKTRPGD